MRHLGVFNFLTLNGFYKGLHGDISWHRHGEEENKFAEGNMSQESIILFGRITYELMASYWPTPMAKENDPVVAEGMNRFEKIVFSNTLKKAEWENSRIVNGDIVGEISRMKEQPGKNLTILGSGSIVTQFAEHGLIDEYQVMIDPVAIGYGTAFLNGIGHKLDLELTDMRKFKSGVVLLTYKTVK